VRRLSAALFFLAVAAPAQAEWTIVSADSEPGRGSISHRHVILENAGERADVDLAIFSTSSCTLRVIDNPSGHALAEVMSRATAVAGVNGGYFDPDFAPIGLRIIDREMIHPLVRARLLTGVLFASARGVQIVRAGEFTRRDVTMAIQCGPFLVDVGKQIRGLDNSRPARRTFAAVGTTGHAALGVCSDVTLAEMSGILSLPKLAGDVKVQRVLNLDGGSSSAFWFARAKGGAFSISEQKTIRDFVGIVPSR